MTAPTPLLVRRQDFAELSVTADDGQHVILTLGRPDCDCPPDEYCLEVSDAVDLIERLVSRVSEIRGYTPPPDGAGPLSSTF